MPITFARLSQARTALIEVYKKTLDPALLAKLDLDHAGKTLKVNDNDSPDVRALKSSLNVLHDFQALLLATQNKSWIKRYASVATSIMPFIHSLQEVMPLITRATTLAGALNTEQQYVLSELGQVFQSLSEMIMKPTATAADAEAQPTKKSMTDVFGSMQQALYSYVTPGKDESYIDKALHSLHDLALQAKSALPPRELASMEQTKSGHLYKEKESDSVQVKSAKSLINSAATLQKMMQTYNQMKGGLLRNLPELKTLIGCVTDLYGNMQNIAYAEEFGKLSAQTSKVIQRMLTDINPILKQIVMDVESVELEGLQQGTLHGLLNPILTRTLELQEKFQVTLPEQEKAPFTADIVRVRQLALQNVNYLLDDFSSHSQVRDLVTNAQAILQEYSLDNLDKIPKDKLQTLKDALPHLDCHPDERKEWEKTLQTLIDKPIAPPPLPSKWKTLRSISSWAAEKLAHRKAAWITGTDHSLLDSRVAGTLKRWADEVSSLQLRKERIETRLLPQEIADATNMVPIQRYAITDPQEQAKIFPTWQLGGTVEMLAKLSTGIREAITNNMDPAFVKTLGLEQEGALVVNKTDAPEIRNMKIFLNLLFHAQGLTSELNNKGTMDMVASPYFPAMHAIGLIENLSKLDLNFFTQMPTFSELFSANTADIVQACQKMAAQIPQIILTGKPAADESTQAADKARTYLKQAVDEMVNIKSAPAAIEKLEAIAKQKLSTLLTPTELTDLQRQEAKFSSGKHFYKIHDGDSANLRNTKALLNILYANKKLIKHFLKESSGFGNIAKIGRIVKKLQQMNEAYQQLDLSDTSQRITTYAKEALQNIFREMQPIMEASLLTTDLIEDQTYARQNTLSGPLQLAFASITTLQKKWGVQVENKDDQFPFKTSREETRQQRILDLEEKKEEILKSEKLRMAQKAQAVLIKNKGQIIERYSRADLEELKSTLDFLNLDHETKARMNKAIDYAMEHPIAKVDPDKPGGSFFQLLEDTASALINTFLTTMEYEFQEGVKTTLEEMASQVHQIDLAIDVIRNRKEVGETLATAEAADEDEGEGEGTAETRSESDSDGERTSLEEIESETDTARTPPTTPKGGFNP